MSTVMTLQETRAFGHRTNHGSLDYSTDAWPAEDRRRLITAYRAGGLASAKLAFPTRSDMALKAAFRRFSDQRPTGRPAEPIDRNAVRSRIHAIPTELLLTRVCELIQRRGEDDGERPGRGARTPRAHVRA